MNRTTHPRKRAALAAFALALGLGAMAVACSSDDGDDTTAPVATGPGVPLEVVALDIEFEDTRLTAPAGNIEITLVQQGKAPHDFVVEGRPDIRLEVDPGQEGDTDTGTYAFDPGTYTFFCSVPGHRGAGMEGVLTVTGT